jgi:regulatory protein
MDFLARREYGQTELIRKLADKGYKRSVAEQAISHLTDEGLQSDRRFAESFVQSRVNQGKGPVRIRLDLGQRAISDAVIEAALNEPAADWIALAREVRVKKFGRGYPADFKAKAQQMRFLQYRGFEQDHIQRALAFEVGCSEDD